MRMEPERNQDDAQTCPWEDRVARASTAGDLDPRTSGHVEHCAACRDVAAMIRALAEEGRAEERRALRSVPDADDLILLAGRGLFSPRQLADNAALTLAEKALRPVVWIERIALLVAIIAFLVCAAWIVGRGSAGMAADLGGILHSVGPARAERDVSRLVIGALALVIVAVTGYGLGGFRTGGSWMTRNGF